MYKEKCGLNFKIGAFMVKTEDLVGLLNKEQMTCGVVRYMRLID
jgi:hypothetical protein